MKATRKGPLWTKEHDGDTIQLVKLKASGKDALAMKDGKGRFLQIVIPVGIAGAEETCIKIADEVCSMYMSGKVGRDMCKNAKDKMLAERFPAAVTAPCLSPLEPL